MNAKIKQLLDYQKVEAELIKLERTVEDDPNFAVKNKMVAVVQEAQSAAQQLEQQAKQSVAEFDKLKAIYEENYVKAEKLNAIDIDKLNDDQLIKLNSELENILKNLDIIEKRLHALNSGVEQILERFEKAKKNAYVAKSHYQKAKAELDKLAEKTAPQRQKLQDELDKMKAAADKTLITKYLAIRKDKVFPVLVKFNDSRCGACRMEQSKVTVGRLTTDGFIECENCRRIIYAE